MALPAAGLITLAMIAAEFGGSPPYSMSQFYRGGGRVTRNNLSVPTSGAISLSQFRGAQKSVAGSASWGAGSYGVAIPAYDTLTMEILGSGGGGGGTTGSRASDQNTWFGGTGAQSYFAAPSGTIYANGGTGGGNCSGVGSGSNGSPGAGYYGDAMSTGGGNAGGGPMSWNQYIGGYGGAGGYVRKTWRADDPGAPVAGGVYSLVLGPGGAGGYATWASGNPGAGATARMSWT
ncbi:hypothetical protein QkW1_45 [Ralstonia phage QkW1]